MEGYLVNKCSIHRLLAFWLNITGDIREHGAMSTLHPHDSLTTRISHSRNNMVFVKIN